MPLTAEVLNPSAPRGRFRAAVFDFDGTVSLIREGWAGIMADMGAELLADPAPELRHELEDAVLRLSGKPTIFQMRALVGAVAARNRPAPDETELLAEFFRRLFAVADQRKAELASGTAPPAKWAVPGAHPLLDAFQARGVELYLASGTDLAHVRAEAALLDLTKYFGDRIYGPVNDSPDFSKRTVIEKIVRDHGLSGDELIGFGDGFAETVEVKRAGGFAVGVASHEAGRDGVNPLKRALLSELGADVIVPHYADHAELVAWLFSRD